MEFNIGYFDFSWFQQGRFAIRRVTHLPAHPLEPYVLWSIRSFKLTY